MEAMIGQGITSSLFGLSAKSWQLFMTSVAYSDAVNIIRQLSDKVSYIQTWHSADQSIDKVFVAIT